MGGGRGDKAGATLELALTTANDPPRKQSSRPPTSAQGAHTEVGEERAAVATLATVIDNARACAGDCRRALPSTAAATARAPSISLCLSLSLSFLLCLFACFSFLLFHHRRSVGRPSPPRGGGARPAVAAAAARRAIRGASGRLRPHSPAGGDGWAGTCRRAGRPQGDSACGQWPCVSFRSRTGCEPGLLFLFFFGCAWKREAGGGGGSATVTGPVGEEGEKKNIRPRWNSEQAGAGGPRRKNK